MSRLYADYAYQFSSMYKPAARERPSAVDGLSKPEVLATRSNSTSQLSTHLGRQKTSAARRQVSTSGREGARASVGSGDGGSRKRWMSASRAAVKDSVMPSVRRTASQSAVFNAVCSSALLRK